MKLTAPAGHFVGKYRATVANNIDPEQRGRLQMFVPDVYGPTPSTWAEACVPLAGPTGPPMGVYFVPPIGAGVWAEFEHGDPDYPIWSGCRWGAASDIPPAVKLGTPTAPSLVLQSLGQHSISISDAPSTPGTGGVMLKSLSGAMIVVNDSGIYIDNGKGASICLVGPTVTVNTGALTIT